jgi:hypothetical protein
MKFLLSWIILFSNLSLHALTQQPEFFDLSDIQRIDNLDLPSYYEAPSETCYPEDLKDFDEDTSISESRARDIFNNLERDPRARNRVAGGKCIYRRIYIQRYLKRFGIASRGLYINCPSNRGRLRLIDQVTGSRYTFSNFHDTNVVSIRGLGYFVMDIQFLDRPVALGQYLARLQSSQKLKPLANRSSGDRGFCYWSVSGLR